MANPEFPGNSILLVFVKRSFLQFQMGLHWVLLWRLVTHNATMLQWSISEQNRHFLEDVGFHPFELYSNIEEPARTYV